MKNTYSPKRMKSYQKSTIDNINKETKVSKKLIKELLAALHNQQYRDDINKLIPIILLRTNSEYESNILNSNFIDSVKKKVMASNNNEEIKRLNDLINKIVEDILKSNGKSFNNYSKVYKVPFRKVIIYGLTDNLIEYFKELNKKESQQDS